MLPSYGYTTKRRGTKIDNLAHVTCVTPMRARVIPTSRDTKNDHTRGHRAHVSHQMCKTRIVTRHVVFNSNNEMTALLIEVRWDVLTLCQWPVVGATGVIKQNPTGILKTILGNITTNELQLEAVWGSVTMLRRTKIWEQKVKTSRLCPWNVIRGKEGLGSRRVLLHLLKPAKGRYNKHEY